jgi:transposase
MSVNKTYSLAEKRRVCELLESDEISRSMAARTFQVPYSTVCAWFKQYSDHDGVIEQQQRGRRPEEKLSQDDKNAIQEWINEDCLLTLQEISTKLRTIRNVDVCQETVRKAITGFHYSLKRTSVAGAAAFTPELQQQRRAFAMWLLNAELHRDKVIFLDETGFKIEMRRRMGRSLVGQIARVKVPRIRTRNVSTMCAMSQNGIAHYKVLEGSGNAERFIVFLNELFTHLPELGFTLVMDNVKFHHNPQVQQLILTRGHFTKFLPVYSPYLNPIEYFFNEWKGFVKAAKPTTDGELQTAIHLASTRVTIAHCAHYVSHVESNCLKVLNNEQNIN